MNKTIENLKSGNYEVVDNQGVSVTNHFIECLEKELANFIEPKFKIGQEVWFIDGKIVCGEVEEFEYIVSKYKEFYKYFIDGYGWLLQKQLFATEEEAKAKMKK